MRNLGFIFIVIIFAAVMWALMSIPGEDVQPPALPEPVIETEVAVFPLPDIEVEGTAAIIRAPRTENREPRTETAEANSNGNSKQPALWISNPEWPGEISPDDIPGGQSFLAEKLNWTRGIEIEYDTTIVDTVFKDAFSDTVLTDSIDVHVDVSFFPLADNARVRVEITSREQVRQIMTITQPVLEEPKPTWHFEAGVYYGRIGGAGSMALYSCIYHDRFPVGLGIIGTAETVLIGINVRLR